MLMAVKKAKEASFKKMDSSVCYFPECYPESEEHRPS